MDYLQEIAELREELRRHSIAYYDKDAPTISDFEYDAMMRRLENLEAEHPETVTPDSPTQHVGGHRSEKFSPVHHAVPLESLSDVFSYEELTDFIRKTNETLGGDPLYHADGTANVNDPVNVAAIELVNNMMNVDHTAPTHTDSVTQKLSQEGMFITGKSAMTIGPWMVRSIKDRDNYPHDFKTAFAPYPTIDGVRTYTQGGYGDHLCINPKSKHIDAAWEFMKWYATEGMLPLTSGGRVPSANTYDSVEVTEYFLKGAEDLLDAETAQNVLIVPASNHAVPSITTKLPEINKVLTEELENIYTGVKTVQQGMDDAQARAEALLAK